MRGRHQVPHKRQRVEGVLLQVPRGELLVAPLPLHTVGQGVVEDISAQPDARLLADFSHFGVWESPNCNVTGKSAAGRPWKSPRLVCEGEPLRKG